MPSQIELADAFIFLHLYVHKIGESVTAAVPLIVQQLGYSPRVLKMQVQVQTLPESQHGFEPRVSCPSREWEVHQVSTEVAVWCEIFNYLQALRERM